MEIFIGWIFLSVLVGVAASSRGRGSGTWFLLAMIFSPLLAIIGLVLVPNLKSAPNPETHVKCPDCAELVLKEAKVCKHCGTRLIPSP